MNALFFELLIWLTAPGAVRADRASFQTVSFTDFVCGQEGGFTCCLKRPLTAAGEPPPEVPVRVEMPAKFIPRVLGASGATLWGLEDDLDRVTASRDFKALRRGVFQVRASVNVLY